MPHFILSVKFLTCNLKFLESYKQIFFFLQLRMVFASTKLPISLDLTFMEERIYTHEDLLRIRTSAHSSPMPLSSSLLATPSVQKALHGLGNVTAHNKAGNQGPQILIPEYLATREMDKTYSFSLLPSFEGNHTGPSSRSFMTSSKLVA